MNLAFSSGVWSKLKSRSPPYPPSSIRAELSREMISAINGDEFPITWGKDGNQYTGAGDNHQIDGVRSPLSFFQVRGGPTELNCTHNPTPHDQPAQGCTGIREQGDPIPVRGPVGDVCPKWENSVPNLKSSGVLSVDGVLYWAVACFNYG